MHSTMENWRIIGHRRAVRGLARAAATESPAHAYLITGPAQIGKRTLARELAAALNCTAAPDQRPCHACPNCKMTLKEAHPDLIVVERSAEKRMGVEQVRDAREQVDWRPYQGRFKTYVFVDADDISEGASNALLKTLEEPPPQIVVVLTAAQADAVPTTVVSRCRVLPLQPGALDEVAGGLRALHDASPEEAHRLATLCNGRAGWAVAALADPPLAAQREAELARAIELSEGKLGTRLLLAAQACKGENFLESRALCLRTLEDMQTWWRDLLMVASGASAPLAHAARRQEIERQIEKRGRARIVRGLREIEITASAVERNVTPRLALEALLLRLN